MQSTQPHPFNGKSFVRTLTSSPGVYRHFDADISTVTAGPGGVTPASKVEIKTFVTIESNAKVVKDSQAVLADLAEFERVLSRARSIGAKRHFSIDF